MRSLRYRFNTIMLAASASFAIAVIALTYSQALTALESRTMEATSALMSAQERPLADLVLVEDQLSLRDYTTDLQQLNPRWLQVQVIDAHGRVLAAAPDELGVAGDPEDHVNVQRDLLTPRIGSVHVVLDLAPDRRAANSMAVHVCVAMALLTTMGVTLALLMGHWITRPLEQMAAHVDRLREGGVGEVIEVPGPDDELAHLARAINQMSAGLGEAQAALLQQERQLMRVESLAAIGEFAAGAAHEVANPLAGVAGCVRRLAKADLPDERRERYARVALEGLDRSTRVLKDLLAYARAERRPPKWVKVASLIEDTVTLVSKSCAVRPEVQAPADEVLAHWPPGQIEQVLANLLLNAGRVARRELLVRWYVHADDVVIEVVDDGPGIPPEVRQRIFEPFFTTLETGQGTGLGLSVSSSIVSALGGALSLGSRPGGATGTLAQVRVGRNPGGAHAA